MSSILYIGNDYCRTLEQLQEYFHRISSDEDSLYNELLTLQRDGLIVQWLQEGSETEKMLAKRIKKLPTNLTNKDEMEKLAEILINKNKNFNVNFHSYLELKKVEYALGTSSKIESAFKEISNKGSVIDLRENHLNETLQFRLKFKVLKPEKEAFCLKATLLLRHKVIFDKSTFLCLNNESIGEEKIVSLKLPTTLLKKGEGEYLLELKSESQTLFSTKVLIDDSSMLFAVNGVKFKMIKVQGGEFKMGCPDSDATAWDSEKPQHDVTLKEFYIGETVVTQALWKAVMATNPSSFKGDNLPVETVSYDDVTQFLRRLNERMEGKLYGKKFALPTEEQWEFAARGGVNSRRYLYSGSNNINKVAWCDTSSNNCTHPVKDVDKSPNELNIYGMSGNVWEWCNSVWRENYKVDAGAITRWSSIVRRGGSYRNIIRECRVTCRDRSSYDSRLNNLGFRLILQ